MCVHSRDTDAYGAVPCLDEGLKTHRAASVPLGLVVRLAVGHCHGLLACFVDPVVAEAAAAGSAHHRLGPGRGGSVAAVFVGRAAGPVAHSHSRLDMQRAAVSLPTRPAGRSIRRPIARGRPGRSRSRNTAGRTGHRRPHAAAAAAGGASAVCAGVAAQVPVRNIAAGAAAGNCRTAGMPWWWG